MINLSNVQKKVAQLLALENLSIYQADVNTAMFRPDTRELIIPYFKTEFKGKEIPESLLIMFIGHEVGHALNTPASGMHQFNKDAKYKDIPFIILNIIEDARIEKMIKNQYPGMVLHFKKAYDFLLNNSQGSKGFLDPLKMSLINRINYFFKYHAVHENAPTFDEIFPCEKEKKLINFISKSNTFDEVLKACEITMEIIKEKNKQKKQQKIDVFDEQNSNKKTEIPSELPSENNENTDPELQEENEENQTKVKIQNDDHADESSDDSENESNDDSENESNDDSENESNDGSESESNDGSESESNDEDLDWMENDDSDFQKIIDESLEDFIDNEELLESKSGFKIKKIQVNSLKIKTKNPEDFIDFL